ncbi:hypothetical protein PRVXT_002705 [Proteinivorax tanatarense]|uniref:Tetratricopeptide repeat protein n=1 Tax=Proteinivorax tanatarense TaxID=1260629 RepID=A0AAU7VKT0_9FIRM
MELKKYLDNPRIYNEEKIRTYPLILCNLSKWLANAKRYHECIAMCDRAIDYCIENDSLEILADVNFNKGFALNKIGNKEDAILYITQSYYIAKACKKEDMSQVIKDFLLDNYTIKV